MSCLMMIALHTSVQLNGYVLKKITIKREKNFGVYYIINMIVKEI